MNPLRELYEKLSVRLLSALCSEKGQGLAEYGLILVLIAVVVILMVTSIGQKTNDMLSTVNSAIPQ